MGEFFYNPTISRHFLPFGWGLALGAGVEMVGFCAISARFCAISSHFFAFLGGFGSFLLGGDGHSANALPPTGAHWPQAVGQRK